MEKTRAVTGVAIDENTAKVGILQVPDKPGIAARVFSALSAEKINVDMIIQSVHSLSSKADMAFTVSKTDLHRAVEITKKIARQLKAKEVVFDPKVAKVSIVGVGMISQPGVAAQMFKALSDARINIEMISTSEIKISCVVALENGRQALKILHDKFELGKK